jgi:hypothetical protein
MIRSSIAESWGVEDFLNFWLQLGMELKPEQAFSIAD